jgi:hypothetical protein
MEITEEAVHHICKDLGSTGFRDVRKAISVKLQRPMEKNEQDLLQRLLVSEGIKHEVDNGSSNVIVCTAYSSDYTIGSVCSSINESYAERHSLPFRCNVLDYSEMLAKVHPKQHCTWYKIRMMLDIFNEKMLALEGGIGYLMWIDAG